MDLMKRSFGPLHPQSAERIIGSAVVDKHGTVYVMAPPARHHDCMQWAPSVKKTPPIPPYRQGFFTNYGRYVDRKQAMIIAKSAGQLLSRAPTGEPDTLYSEDLW